MAQPLHILMLEDSATDAELIERELRRAGMNFVAKRVESLEMLILALADFSPDIILSDYNLPGFSGIEALKMVRCDYPEIPLIFVTGALSDKDAAELIGAGARDYVLKDRLARLAPAVQRALSVEKGVKVRKLTEAQLQQKTALLENIINTSPDYIFVKDRELRMILCNAVFAAALGKMPEELYGKTDAENGWDTGQDKAQAGIRGYEQDDLAVLEGDVVRTTDMAKIGGEIRHFDTMKIPLKSMRGEIFGLLGISRDITERKRSEEDFQRFFNLIPDLVCIASADGHFLKINPMWHEVLGYAEQEILALPFLDLIHPDDKAATLKEVESQLAGDAAMEFTNRYRCKDGSYRWLEWRATPAVDKKLLFASARDISERIKSDERLRLTAKVPAALQIADRNTRNGGIEGFCGSYKGHRVMQEFWCGVRAR